MKDQGSRIVPAPVAGDPRLRSPILDVVCGLNEEIEWHWTLTDHGRFVSGYSIVRRLPKPYTHRGRDEELRRHCPRE